MDLLAHCPYCGGDGHGDRLLDGSGYVPCLTCDGTGKIEVVPLTTHQGAVTALEAVYAFLIHNQRDAALIRAEDALVEAGVDPSTYRGQ